MRPISPWDILAALVVLAVFVRIACLLGEGDCQCQPPDQTADTGYVLDVCIHHQLGPPPLLGAVLLLF